MRKAYAKAAVAICAMVVLAGCGKENSGGGTKVAASFATPRDAVKTMTEALKAQDRDTFLACFVGTEPEMALAQVMFDFSREGGAFRDTMIDRHGQQAWEKFQDPAGGGARINLFGGKDPAVWLTTLSFEEEGDTATCADPEESEKLPLVRERGQWRVKAAALAPPKVDPQQLAGVMRRAAEVVRKYRKRLEEPGVDLAKLDKEMGREIFKALTTGE